MAALHALEFGHFGPSFAADLAGGLTLVELAQVLGSDLFLLLLEDVLQVRFFDLLACLLAIAVINLLGHAPSIVLVTRIVSQPCLLLLVEHPLQVSLPVGSALLVLEYLEDVLVALMQLGLKSDFVFELRRSLGVGQDVV